MNIQRITTIALSALFLASCAKQQPVTSAASQFNQQTISNISSLSVNDDRFFCVDGTTGNSQAKRLFCVDKYKPISAQRFEFQQTYLRNSIRQVGGQVIQQGARLQLVLPVDAFFMQGTTHLMDARVPVMQEVAMYLKNYAQQYIIRYPIKVYAYSDNSGSAMQQRQLTQQYAQTVAAFLWNRGFSVTQLQVVGYGNRHAIADNATPQGRAWNRRVMIQVN